MRLAIYPGSFDPMTNGHLDVLSRAATIFDQVVVAVLHNPDKRPLFSIDERMQLIGTAAANLTNVRVDSFMGLLVDYAKQLGAPAIVRGLREVSDFENELKMSHMNRHLFEQAVTVFIPTNHEYSFLSSSLVKEVASHGGDLAGLVPQAVAVALRQKFPLS